MRKPKIPASEAAARRSVPVSFVLFMNRRDRPCRDFNGSGYHAIRA
jgi:hypothetical protein